VLASLAAVGSVIAASSCCLPLLPFLFAAGVAGTSAFAAQLRPYLLLLSFSAIVVFVFIFFPQVIANLVADLLAGKS